MKNHFSLLIFLLTVLMISGCSQNNKDDDKDAPKEEVNIIDTTSNVISEENDDLSDSAYTEDREPTDDELNEYGDIISIEDGPYPMYSVTINFRGRGDNLSFNLNIEDLGMDPAFLSSLNGKAVKFYYTSELENNLADIQFNGKLLFGEYGPSIDPSWKKVTGILSGAEAETVSDLPDEIYVTDKNGEQYNFEYYITPEMVTANGKEVTAFYYLRDVNNITYIQPIEN